MTRLLRRWWWLVALFATGCVISPHLAPAPGVARPAGRPDVAFTEVAGIRLWAGGEWTGDPPGLVDVMTPMLLTFENQSQRPLRVSARDCALVGASGFRYVALPPFPLPEPVSALDRGQVVLADYHPAKPVKRPPPVHPRTPPRHFFVAPPFIPFYPGLAPWPHPWLWDVHVARLYSTWPTALPSRDMLELALPEGVLQPGGRVTGYVYFQHVRERAVNLEVKFVDAETQASLGVATLPFAVYH